MMTRQTPKFTDRETSARTYLRSSRRWIIGVATASCVAMASLLWAVPADAQTTSVSSTLGVYAGPGDASGAESFGSDVGLEPTYAMDFLDGTSWTTMTECLETWILSAWAPDNSTKTWGVDMLPNTGASLATGATGAYDGYFKTIATQLVAGGQANSIIRLGWEFNGDWFSWYAGGKAQAFISYWQQIVTTMRSVPGANFKFEWNPARGGSLPLASYYPGDQYVDYIGMDVYDEQWNVYPGAQAEWQYMLTEPYGLNWLASFADAHGKQITFPEWGIVDDGTPPSGGDNGYFIDQMASWIGTHDVAEANYWQYGSSQLFQGNTPNADAAFIANFGPNSKTVQTSTMEIYRTATNGGTRTSKDSKSKEKQRLNKAKHSHHVVSIATLLSHAEMHDLQIRILS